MSTGLVADSLDQAGEKCGAFALGEPNAMVGAEDVGDPLL